MVANLIQNFYSLDVAYHSLTVSLPYLPIVRGEGLKVLLTAGSDGDEYDGIEAAQRLANKWYNDSTWSGTRIIFPLLNPLGNAASVSWNPVDRRFPKTIFPGKSNGTLSEQLISLFWQKLEIVPDLWLDLHGGSQVEWLDPFVWGFPVGSLKMRKKTKFLLQSLSTQRRVFAPWFKVNQIARLGCLYVVLESGQMGELNHVSVQRHMDWVENLIQAYDATVPAAETVKYFSKVRYYSFSEGYWQPAIQPSQMVLPGDYLGSISQFDGLNPLVAKGKGEVLWCHAGGWIYNNDTLLAVGEELRS